MATSNYPAGLPKAHLLALGIPVETEDAERIRALEEQLTTLRMEFADIYRELYAGAQMQRSLSGPRLLRRGVFEVAAEIFPVRHLSGDFFNVSDAGTTTLLAIGDIAGKGLLAAMWFTHVLELTRTCGELFHDPARALAAINRKMCGADSAPPLTSLFLGRLDPDTGKLVYCNAGHPAPILLRASGDLQYLDEGGPVLGAVDDAGFRSGSLILEPGDTLVGYSDGLLECRNEDGEEFGRERVLAEVLKSSMSGTQAMLFSIIGAAQDFAGSHAREDDCTLMVTQRFRANELPPE